jgi:SpoIVB peptidase S55
MKRLISLALSILVAVSVAYAQDSPKSLESSRFFPLDQVKPGMRAVGYTVFDGSEPKPFDVEILGVLKGFPNPQQSAILTRLLGTTLEHTGVFQGMSGSPVYIDGKLLGAVAFGYQFAKDPIAGVTPIQQMIDVFEQRQPGDGSTAPDKPRPLSFSEIAFDERSPAFAAFVRGLNGANGQQGNSAQATSGPASGLASGLVSGLVSGLGGQILMPIATPLAITGVPPEIIARFAPQFQAWGFNPVAGAASAVEIGGLKRSNDETLKPGSTIVVPLVRGDFSLAAAGTVTYRDGNRIYAFGHPFLSLGVSDFPMNEGSVVTVMSSAAVSFKLSAPASMVGAVRGDRSTGIYGELGAVPRMIPVEINVQTSRGANQTYRFEMISDRVLTPLLLQMTTLATISSTERTMGDSTLQLRGKISLKGQPEIRLENRLSSSLNAAMAAAFAVSTPISALLNSGFSDLSIERISFDVISQDARKTGQLDRLWIDRTEVHRGDKLEVQAFARNDSGREYVERISVDIPVDAPVGPLQVVVGDGSSLQASEPKTGVTPKSLGQLVREINKIRKPDRLYLRLARSENGAVINNEELPSLPPSVLATLGSNRTTGGYTLTRSTTLLEKELPAADFIISGQRTLTVNVVNQ